MRRKFRLPGIIFRIIAIVAAASLCISYISVYISPVVTTIPLFFGLYFIPLVILNVLLLIISLIFRSNAGWITFIFLLPALLFTDMFVRWEDGNQGEAGNSLKICTYNVGVFSLSRKDNREETINNIRRFIADNSPDIVCFQEYHTRESENLFRNFSQYPYTHHHLFRKGSSSYIGNVILSKFPIVDAGKLLFDDSGNLCIYADIDYLGNIIRVYNVHLESNAISFTTLIKSIREGGDLSEQIYSVHDKVALTFKKRALQVDEVVRHFESSPHKAIICGDFNDTPMSYTYHSLVRNKKDSFKESGKGFSATYSIFWPLLRIDYILYPESFWSMSHSTPRVDYSDHYPVISEIIIP